MLFLGRMLQILLHRMPPDNATDTVTYTVTDNATDTVTERVACYRGLLLFLDFLPQILLRIMPQTLLRKE